MIAIVDYGAGNIRSVLNALRRSLDCARDDTSDCARDDMPVIPTKADRPEMPLSVIPTKADRPRGGISDSVVLTSDKNLLRSASHVILPGVGEASTAMQALRDAGLADFIPTLKQPVLGICVGAQLMCAGSEEGDVRCMGIFPAEVRRFKETPTEKVPHMGWNSLYDPRVSSLEAPHLSPDAPGVSPDAPHLSSLEDPNLSPLEDPNLSSRAQSRDLPHSAEICARFAVHSLRDSPRGLSALVGMTDSSSRQGFSSPLFAGLKQGEYVYFVHSYYPEVCANTIAICNHGIDFSAALSRDNFYACQFHPEKSGTAGERILKNFLAL